MRRVGARGFRPFVLIGDPSVLAERARALGLDIEIATVGEAAEAPFLAETLPVLPVSVAGDVVAGHPQLCRSGRGSAIDRAGRRACPRGRGKRRRHQPDQQSDLTSAGFGFPGHTEFLAALAGREASDAVMMLIGEELKVVPVTIHMPLKDVFGALSTERILKTLEITARDVARYFGVARPRIAVTGLNPHAGEDGTMGREEIDVIMPAIAAARRHGLDVTGPLPRRHAVPRRGAQELRRRRGHVSRPGAYPLQDARLRHRRQRHARAALRAHLAGPRHGLCACRHPTGKPPQPDRGLAVADTMRQRGRSALSTQDGLPPLRDIIRDLGLSARQSLGQNFLLDFNLTRRIARAAGPLEGATIVEVGPGPGGLTRALLLEGASRVIAIEKDERCLPALDDIAEAYPDGSRLSPATRARSTSAPSIYEARAHRRQPALQRRHAAPDRLAQDRALAALVHGLVLMFQREVALRIVAKPGGKDYGRLAVLTQWRTTPRILLTLPAAAFTPRPKVNSSLWSSSCRKRFRNLHATSLHWSG